MESITNLRVGVGKFYYGGGCIAMLPREIRRLGGKPFFIGGERSTRLVLDACGDGLAQEGILPSVHIHGGACSRASAEELGRQALQEGCTVIVGIGGGKCLDLAKCAATFAKMDLINVPTSVATCAASSTVCIMYTAQGRPDGSVAMLKEVDVVIADTGLIATAPKRTLAAGIFDSIAKYPEVIHNRIINSHLDCELEKYICVVNSQAIYTFLLEEGGEVYEKGAQSPRFRDVVLTNLLHTSIVSGFSYGVDQLALAHGLYSFMRDAFTLEAGDVLHGEIVAVGVIMQMVFNGAPEAERERVIAAMRAMDMPLTLREIGFVHTPVNMEKLEAYLLQATALTPGDLPRLREAIATIC